jgi:hypothetical protein
MSKCAFFFFTNDTHTLNENAVAVHSSVTSLIHASSAIMDAAEE